MCQRQVLWLFGTSSPTFWMSCRISTDTPDRKVARLTQARSAGACAGIAAIAAQLGTNRKRHSIAFKRHVGDPPAAWRAKARCLSETQGVLPKSFP